MDEVANLLHGGLERDGLGLQGIVVHAHLLPKQCTRHLVLLLLLLLLQVLLDALTALCGGQDGTLGLLGLTRVVVQLIFVVLFAHVQVDITLQIVQYPKEIMYVNIKKIYEECSIMQRRKMCWW